jgi:hypothetical protein
MEKSIKNFILSLFVLTFSFSSVYAETMSSSRYKIESDSVNFGGLRSSSALYSLEDTLGESATGISSSTNYVMKAGYEQMHEVVLMITPASDVVMSPAIGGITGGVANGSTDFTVTTDNSAGYTVTITASSSPALQSSSNSFSDYVPAGAVPDFVFTNSAASSSFGFSPEGNDIAGNYKNDGSSCGTGSNVTNGCWDGLSTSPKTIVSRASANHPNGTVTTLRFRAESGSSHIQADGLYVATTTITVLPQ